MCDFQEFDWNYIKKYCCNLYGQYLLFKRKQGKIFVHWTVEQLFFVFLLKSCPESCGSLLYKKKWKMMIMYAVLCDKNIIF